MEYTIKIFFPLSVYWIELNKEKKERKCYWNRIIKIRVTFNIVQESNGVAWRDKFSRSYICSPIYGIYQGKRTYQCVPAENTHKRTYMCLAYSERESKSLLDRCSLPIISFSLHYMEDFYFLKFLFSLWSCRKSTCAVGKVTHQKEREGISARTFMPLGVNFLSPYYYVMFCPVECNKRLLGYI